MSACVGYVQIVNQPLRRDRWLRQPRLCAAQLMNTTAATPGQLCYMRLAVHKLR